MKYFDEEDAIAEYEKQLQKKDKEIERLNKESEQLRTALNSKESIIKEVREYINSISWNTTIPNIQDNVWRILDKEQE